MKNLLRLSSIGKNKRRRTNNGNIKDGKEAQKSMKYRDIRKFFKIKIYEFFVELNSIAYKFDLFIQKLIKNSFIIWECSKWLM